MKTISRFFINARFLCFCWALVLVTAPICSAQETQTEKLASVHTQESTTSKLTQIIAQATKLPTDTQKLIIDYAAGYWEKQNIAYTYVVIAPVADATTKPITSFDATKSAEQLHAELPFSPETGPNSCVRAHQLLFNECVTVTQELGDEVECEINTAFYSDPKKEPVNKFWTLKKYLRPLTLMSSLLYAIPAPYGDLKTQKIIIDNCITLTEPWSDTAHAITYSAGTRFVRSRNLDTQSTFGSCVVDSKTNRVREVSIPKTHALCAQHMSSFDTKFSLFLGLLSNWAQKVNGKIPYVWGGCSYVTTCNPKDFSLVSTQHGPNSSHVSTTSNKSSISSTPISYWVRPTTTYPQTGFDCSGMVLRAAQICGLNYFYKNTTTLTHYLKQLAPSEHIKLGDLIWIPGHVMVVSSLERAELIHASGYAHCLASVNTSKLSELFKDVHNFAQLSELYQKQIPLKFLDMNGKLIKEIPSFAIYRITQ